MRLEGDPAISYDDPKPGFGLKSDLLKPTEENKDLLAEALSGSKGDDVVIYNIEADSGRLASDLKQPNLFVRNSSKLDNICMSEQAAFSDLREIDQIV
mmetsp:Transcript_35487/g.54282  ORF Transcript_35487/g.54282 Transcript_35487/m.54282 type:complete len:98 (-) Transcript_35487:1914-2207(-)